MVVVTTRNRIRICLDPKDLTKVVIRPKEQLELLKVELDPEESIHSVKNSLLSWRKSP